VPRCCVALVELYAHGVMRELKGKGKVVRFTGLMCPREWVEV